MKKRDTKTAGQTAKTPPLKMETVAIQSRETHEMPPDKRTCFYGKRAILPECPMVGWSRFDRAKVAGLSPHRHSSCYEICFLVRGSVEWWARSQIFNVEPNDFFVTQPGEEHGGVDAFMHPCELFWIHVRPRNQLLRQLSGLRQRHFKGNASMSAHFERLISEHRQAENRVLEARRTEEESVASARSVFAARAALHLLVVETLRFHDEAARGELAQGRLAAPSPPIARALEWMNRHCAQPDCLRDAARQAGLRGTQFRKRFQAESGFSPQEYLIRARVQEAKRQLQTSVLPVTQIAFELGFSSSQYFATVFRKLVGLTPQEYRRRANP